ncbi:MAG: DUF2272 domain-containing protein [Alphaproteobacteria bacterium]
MRVSLAAGLTPLSGLLFLAACAAVPPPAPEREEPPIAYPSAVRDRIVGIAEREWRAFGGAEIDFADGTPREVRPGVHESDPRVFANILAYWNAVRGPWTGYIRDERARYRSGAPTWVAEAWSAVFVSYVMRSAGIDRDDFPWDAGHRNYVDALIARQDRYGAAAAFQPYDVEDYAPEPGDLVCADRSRPVSARIGSVAERAAEAGRSRGMHCDIVAVVEPGRVGAIGGNVADTVALSWFPTDALGRLLRPASGDPGERTFFAVIRLKVAPRRVATGPASGGAGRMPLASGAAGAEIL